MKNKKELQKEWNALNKEWEALDKQKKKIGEKMSKISAEIDKLTVAEAKAKAPKPLYKKGQVLWRNMDARPGDTLFFALQWYVRISGDPEFIYRENNNSTYAYPVEYIKKDGTPSQNKRRDSECAWQYQLCTLEEAEARGLIPKRKRKA